MPMMRVDDYRASHLDKGADYDADLTRGGFDTYMAVSETRLLERIVPRLFPSGVPRYLDFACGTGRITRVVEPMADVSLGLDLSARMVAEARRKCPRTRFMICDATRQRLAVEPVDLITAFRFFGNAQEELRHSVLRVLRALLVPGGYLVLNHHRNASSLHNLLLRGRGESDGSDLGYSGIRRLLEQHGFRIARSYGIGLWIFRHRLKQSATPDARLARLLEPLSSTPALSRFCPDVVVVARAQ